MQVSVQNPSVLYAVGPVLVPEGLHLAALVRVEDRMSSFGPRIGLVFRLLEGPSWGAELMQAAAVTGSSMGKFADLLRGLGGREGTPATAHALIGRQCWITVRHDRTKGGQSYARIIQTTSSTT